ncbi:hypothetical protein BVRB_018450, partial [Beta vulgaris subsp. vulgaris]
GSASIDEAIIEMDSLDDEWIDEVSRAEPPAMEVDLRDVTTRDTSIQNINSVSGYTGGKWCTRSLVN